MNEKQWDEIHRCVCNLDASCQSLHLSLSDERRAGPELHAKCIRFIDEFFALLTALLQRDNVPRKIKSDLQHCNSSSRKRIDCIRAMDRKKVECDTLLGYPIRSRLQNAMMPRVDC